MRNKPPFGDVSIFKRYKLHLQMETGFCKKVKIGNGSTFIRAAPPATTSTNNTKLMHIKDRYELFFPPLMEVLFGRSYMGSILRLHITSHIYRHSQTAEKRQKTCHMSGANPEGPMQMLSIISELDLTAFSVASAKRFPPSPPPAPPLRNLF